MIRRRPVCWDGPNPSPGEYLAGRKGQLWRIVAVEPIRHNPDVRLRLALEGVQTAPPAARVYPWSKTLPSQRDGPTRARQVASAGGVAAVMQTQWRDPDDIRPNASRQPRKVSGWRTNCPLRRMQVSAGSQIEERHILAADRLRLHADITLHGFTGAAAFEPRTQGFGPVEGPSAAAISRVQSNAELARAMRCFDPPHRRMLTEIVLLNRSLHAWTAMRAQETAAPVNAQIEMGKLLVILDLLASHYAEEIKEDLAADRLMGAA